MPSFGQGVTRRLIAAVERALGRAATDFIGERINPEVHDDRPATRDYPGDFHGIPDLRYAPNPNGRPDTGEVVWTWIPFEEDPTRGKDRPALIVGTDGPWLLVAALTSKDHDRDAEQERRAGRDWIDIGSGAWDSRGRPSEVRINRIIRIDPGTVRREGAVLAIERFDSVAAAIRADARRQR